MQFSAENSYSASTSNFFASTFLKPSLINEILNKPEARIEELLDQEDFIDEIRRGNFRLIDYFAKNTDHIKQLIDYITQVPPDVNDDKRAYQYPILVNEIFEANVDLIMNCFFLSKNPHRDINPGPHFSQSQTEIKEHLQNDKDKTESIENKKSISDKTADLLSYLFGFLDTQEELNPVLAGYFSKLLQKLLFRDKKAMIEFVYKNSKFLFCMVEHIEQHCIAEILPLFICYESYIFDDNTTEYLQIRLKVIDKIFDTLIDNAKHEKIGHIPDVLDEIMHRNETMADGKEIMAKILCQETFHKVLSAFDGKLSNTAAIHIGNTTLLLLGHFSAKISQYSSAGVYALYLQKELDENPIVNTISQHLETLKRFLIVEKPETVLTTFGQNTQSLGIGRLKVVTIIERILRIGSKIIYAQINATGIVKIVTDMFAKFIWNNMLHTSYERLVYTILDKRDPVLLEALFEKAAFVKYVIREIKEEGFELPKRRRKIRKGNMGFIVRIANELNRLGSFDKVLQDELKKNPDWENIVVPYLKDRNELNEKEMGGCHPRNMSFGPMDILMGYSQSGPSMSENFGNNSQASNLIQNNQQPYVSYPTRFDQNEQSLDQTVPQEQKITTHHSFGLRDSLELSSYLPLAKSVESKSKEKEEESSIAETIEKNQSINNQQTTPTYLVSNDLANDKAVLSSEKPSKEIVMNSNETHQKEQNSTSPELKIASMFQNIDITTTKNNISDQKHQEIIQETKNKEQTDWSKRVSEQLRSSNDILSRLKMELSISPTKDAEAQEKEEKNSNIATSNASESQVPSPLSCSSEDKSLRGSAMETKSGKKVKLKVKKTEKLDGSKILEMINKFKGPSSSSSMEFSYTDNSQSESGILSSDSNHTTQQYPPTITPIQENINSEKDNH